jgi:hypothetical protein
MKIVVRTPNWIGDTLMALPAIESFRRNFPSDEIWIAAPAWVREIFAGEEGPGGSGLSILPRGEKISSPPPRNSGLPHSTPAFC